MEQAITIRRKPKTGFTVVENSVFRDKRLTLKSLGMLVYLIHFPSDWKFYESHLSKQFEDGKDSTRSALDLLKKLGYLTITKMRDAKGMYSGSLWEVTETPTLSSITPTKQRAKPVIKPESGNPIMDFPEQDSPQEESPHMEIPPLQSNQSYKGPFNKKETTTTTTPTEEAECNGKEGSSGRSNSLSLPKLPSEELNALLKTVLSECPENLQQDILDEIEGLRRLGRIKVNAISLARGLIKKAKNKEFILSAGIQVAKDRKARIANTNAREHALKAPEVDIQNDEAKQSRFSPTVREMLKKGRNR